MAKEVGVEWVNTYDCLNALTHEHEDAGGFYDELVQHEGWVGSFNWGNSAAWEEDFKRTSKGGTAPTWADSVGFAYFTGHGSPWGFYFRCDIPDDNLVECDGYSGPSNGDLRLGSGDLEWLALEVCNTLQLDASRGGTNLDVFDRWADAFQACTPYCRSRRSASTSPRPAAILPPSATADGQQLSTAFPRDYSGERR